MNSEQPVTALLKATREGDPLAEQTLLNLLYQELHRLAKAYMRRERPDHTLQPTALLHEAYLRLAHEDIDWKSREHFIGIAAHVMRRVLVDHARAHVADRRGGRLKRVDLESADGSLLVSLERADEVLAIHQALTRLTIRDPRQARVVELRYFAGMPFEHIAELLEVSVRSVKRDWSLARLWLFQELQQKAS